MKFVSLPKANFTLISPRSLLTGISLTLLLAILSHSAMAQAQLSLADILIALRSKKVTLQERNKILSDAVRSRGITFSLTPEIEKELGSGGADKDLVESIRMKNSLASTAIASNAAAAQLPPKTEFKPEAKPVVAATPAPPDFAFYQKRGDSYAAKGDLDLALSDFNKAIELKPGEAVAYLSRGNALLGKKTYDLSIADFDKVIELDPASAAAYANRASAHEKKGDTVKAMADYQKAFELDANNDFAKTNLQRLKDEQLKAEQLKAEQAKAVPVPVPAPASVPVVKAPLIVADSKPAPPAGPANVGSLKDYASRLAIPVYSAMDKQRNVRGIVIVEVSLDEEGKVINAKAISGPQSLRQASEDAARRSKFKPVTVGNKAVQAVGFINYNFAL